MIKSGGNQTLAVAGQTHEEFIATRVGVGVRPRRSAVGGFVDDAVACDVNCAVDRNRRPERRLDGDITECPDIAVRAGVDGGILVQSKSAGKKLSAGPSAGCEWNRRGRNRWCRPSNGITADANAIITDGNIARAGVTETVKIYLASRIAAGPFDAVRAG